MPNQRKKGKKLISQWIATGNRKALYSEAERQGKSVSALLDEILETEIKKLKRKARATNGKRNKSK
tara:strand:- start:155 stop:352 length:198 start_codon:yes stop_codon:yes gene_type:complete